MNYSECLQYLADLGQELRGAKFELKNIQAILVSLGSPHLKYPTAIVAGTNGKGSTSAILASILQHAGYRTGLYTSPHLVRLNERIVVDGREIPDRDFALLFSEVQAAVEHLLAEGHLPRLPSFFEFMTATAFLHFARVAVEFAVLEVGMGGRLDATNVTEPRVAVITNIGLDHVEYLGNSPAAIAAEKAGVIRPRRPVISGCEDPDAAEVIRQRCAELHAELVDTPSFVRLRNLQSVDGRYAFDLALNGNYFSQLATPFPGRFQVKNVVAAVAAAWRLAQEGFRIPRRAVLEGLRSARWPGRLEPILDHPLVLLDGGHNPAAAGELARFIKDELPGRRVRLGYPPPRGQGIAESTPILFPPAGGGYGNRP